MVMTDPIADLIVQIKQALLRRKDIVDIPSSKVKSSIARILQEEGYIKSCEVLTRGNKKILRLRLKYGLDEYGKIKHYCINQIKRVSRPGCRIYKKYNEIFRLNGGFGTAIISTSNGLVTDKTARAKKLGGEVLLNVW
ncbi:30S ribosomal protein S8 [Candidatus Margulisiibacteriota bacterium]